MKKDLAERIAALSPKQRELFNLRSKQPGLGFTKISITPIPRTRNILPLSFAQQRLWFMDQLEPVNPAYNVFTAVRIKGELQIIALQETMRTIVERHESLRTTFVMLQDQPVQHITDVADFLVPVVDLGDLPSSQQEIRVQELVSQEAQTGFDLEHGPLLRIRLIQLGQTEQVLVLNMHHIISDGWSMDVFVREMIEGYTSQLEGRPPRLPELPVQYADFAAWQREWLQAGELEKQLGYWKEQLADVQTLNLPSDHTRPAHRSFRGKAKRLSVSQDLAQQLKDLSQRAGVTLFMSLLAVFKVLLSRYSGQTDIAVGSPIANRNRSEIENLIGFFLNTLVLRTNLSSNLTFTELLAREREVTLEAYAHQDLPFEQIVETLQPERDLSHSPLFQVLFVLQNAPIETPQLPGLTMTPVSVENCTAKFDLAMGLQETSQGLVGEIEYNTDIFDEDRIDRMIGHWQTLLSSIVANPDQLITDLPILTDAEEHQLLFEWNSTFQDNPSEAPIYHLFETQASRSPDMIAVVHEDVHLSYQVLNERANHVAHHLQELGVGPETRVGICMDRTAELVVGLLAILKAGGSYVPLDPSYPVTRLGYILTDSAAPVILAERKWADVLTHAIQDARQEMATSPKLVYLDSDEIAIGPSAKKTVPTIAGDNLAYIIYTSGSTGRPKGVAIEHHSALALLHWARNFFAVDGMLASTSICFDLSVFELFLPLSFGGTIVLADNALHLPTLQAAGRVTLINTVPSVMTELLKIQGLPASAYTINLAGEVLSGTLVKQLYKENTVRQVFNLYGPSEDTTYSTFALIDPVDTASPTIGRPILNTQIYLLDTHLRPTPIGVPGELYIGGAGLARGYVNRPDLTAEKFIPHPFSTEPGSRLYKTGDLARFRRDGNIEFLGRMDHQVKLRGFRIELGEIEFVLKQHPDVQDAVVLLREELLVAYVVLDKDFPLSASELRHSMHHKLPEYMVPSIFVSLDALPLTANGKLDRRALSAFVGSQPDLKETFVAPRTPTEEKLVQIWADVLRVERVGVYENFFELGGHSLLVTQVISRIQQVFGVWLSLPDFFGAPTVEGLAGYLDIALASHLPSEKQIFTDDFEHGVL